MDKKWKILVAIIVAWIIISFVGSDGKSYCSDGSTTSSSGRGTCSWHGGQGSQFEKKVVRYITIITVGFWFWNFFIRRVNVVQQSYLSLCRAQYFWSKRK